MGYGSNDPALGGWHGFNFVNSRGNFKNCVFSYAKNESGGAIKSSNSMVDIENSVFSYNKASSGSGVYNSSDMDSNRVKITACEFLFNRGSSVKSNNGNLIVLSNRFHNNSSTPIELYCNGKKQIIAQNLIYQNSGTDGGGINASGDPLIINNTIVENSASTTLLIFQLIKDFVKTHQIFYFEGSMIKGVEHSFRNFGAKQIPYFRISKPNSTLFHLLWLLRKLKNR